MIYTRIEYAMLLIPVFVLYMLFRKVENRSALLLAASLIFYAWAGPFDLGIFLAVIGVSYACVYCSFKFPRWRATWLSAGVIVLALHLLGWKYLPWAGRGFGAEINIPLPLGISFFTLQGIGYLIDVYRRQIPMMTLKEYALFKSFFPQLIAGPIIRGHEMWDFLRTMPNARKDQLIEGLWLIGMGFIKKMIIADYLGIFVDTIFSNPGQLDRATLMFGAVAFYVQIWGDFAGYTDIGRGSALLFGLRLPENFYSTLYANGGTDWSRRWHATLQTWVKDYMYFPMVNFLLRYQPGFLRRETYTLLCQIFGKYFSAMMVALWHGAALNFFIWGLALWVIATVESILMTLGLTQKNPTWRRRVFDIALMLPVFFLTGVFFRCMSTETLMDYLHGLFGQNFNTVSYVDHAGPAYARIALAFAIDGLMYYSLKSKRYIFLEALHRRFKPTLERYPVLTDVLAGVGAAALIVCGLAFRSNNSLTGFIYFRF